MLNDAISETYKILVNVRFHTQHTVSNAIARFYQIRVAIEGQSKMISAFRRCIMTRNRLKFDEGLGFVYFRS